MLDVHCGHLPTGRASLHRATSALWWKGYTAEISPAPATADLCNSGTVIYSSSTVPVTAAPASVLDRKLLLPCYRFLRCDAPAAPVVTMNKAFLPLETTFLAELVNSAAASQKRSRINTVHCTGHWQAE